MYVYLSLGGHTTLSFYKKELLISHLRDNVFTRDMGYVPNTL